MSAVFQGVHFYFVEAKLRNPAEVKQLLRDGGGTREFYVAPLVTHVITDDPLGDGILAPVKDAPVPVVNSDWVRMSSKCGSQLPTCLYEVNVTKLFSGLVFCLSKLSRSDREKLCVMLMFYGGRLQRHLDRNVTHLVTIVTTGAKYDTAVKHSCNIAMVTPNWVLDCIESGKLQEEKGYHPSRVVQTQTQDEQGPWNGDHDTVVFQLAQDPMSLATPTSDPTATPTNGDDCCNVPGIERVFSEPAAVAVMLPSSSKSVVSDEIVLMEVEDIHRTELQVGSLQDPKVTPVQVPVTADNHVTPPVTADNHVTSPVMADNHVTSPVMADNHVTPPVTAGNHVTSPVMADNHVTPPVTADNHVTPPVMDDNHVTPIMADNHMTPPVMTDNHVTPIMTDNHVTPPVGSESTLVEQPLPQFLQGLVFVVKGYQEHLDEGTVQKWKEVIIQHGGDVVEKYDSVKVTHLLALHKNCPDFDMAFRDGKCIGSAHWLNDVLLEQKLFPPCNALHLPTYFKLKVPGTDQLSITLTNYSGTERDLVKDMIRATGIPYTGHLSKMTTHLVCKMPFGRKYERACDLGIKVVNASFLSEVIHNGQIPAILYPRHTKLGSPEEFYAPFYEAVRLLKPWQSFIAEYALHSPQWVNHESTRRAFSILEQAKEEQDDVCAQLIKSGESDVCVEGRVVGHASSVQPSAPCVVFTGINIQLLGHLKKVVLKLGGRVTESVNECTHLVATRIARTVKFLCGISVCQHIVMPQWLDQCNQMNRFVDEAPYVLRDQEAEVLFNMSVPLSLQRARQAPLLKGRQLFATTNVSPPYDSLRQIVHCAGGELLDEQEMRNRFGRTLEHDQNLPLVVISCHEDVESGRCAEFFARNIAVYNPEFILTGVLRQQLECGQNQLFQSIQV